MITHIFKNTTDQWFIPFNMDGQKLVDVSLIPLGCDTDWRVSVWGCGNVRMERDLFSAKKAQKVYIEVIFLGDITMEKLAAIGFRSRGVSCTF